MREPTLAGAGGRADGRDRGAAALPEVGDRAAGRADAFISYSRRDKEFVEHVLVPALAERGKRVWLDVTDIEPAADWRERIRLGIEAARALVFVLSPASVASQPCRDELELATSLNKPLVPVVRVDVPREELPLEIERAEWILLREADPVEPGIEQVVTALETDLAWRDMHNELAIRAREWVRGDRHPSLLLRGRGLAEAERWQADPGPHRESPTAEQTAYIVAGRRAATRRQRGAFATVVAALVVAIGLAAFALVQRSQAIARERTATSLALAAASLDRLRSGDLGQALLLGWQANDVKPTFDARTSMVHALETARGYGLEALVRGHGVAVDSEAYSPDGRLLASADEASAIVLRDARTGRELRRLALGHGFADAISSVVFSPDAHTLAAVTASGLVGLWDVATARPLGRRVRAHTASTALAFSPDGKVLEVADLYGSILLLDWRSGTTTIRHVAAGSSEAAPGSSAAFSADGRILAIGGDDHAIRLWDAQTGQLVEPPFFGNDEAVFDVALSPDERVLASAGEDGTVRLWDVGTGEPLGSALRGDDGAVTSVAFSPSGAVLASGGNDATIRLWDVRSTRLVRSPLRGHTDWIRDLAFSPDGRTLASSDNGGSVLLYATSGALGLALRGHTKVVTRVVFTPDARRLVAAGMDGTVRAWNADGSTPSGRTLTAGADPLDALAVSPDGSLLAYAGEGRDVHLLDLRSGASFGHALRGHTYAVNDLAFSPDGRVLASGANDNTIRLWSVPTGTLLRPPLRGHTNVVYSVAFSPSGRLIASGSHDGTVRIWDAGTGKLVGRPLRTGGGPVRAVAFGRDGTIVAAASTDGRVQLWGVGGGTRSGQPLDARAGPVYGLAFSPDGRTLATASDDGTLRLWDVQTRKPLGAPLAASGGAVRSVAFSPDGRTLASADGDGTVRLFAHILWSTQTELRTMVCGLVSGGLTRAEWSSLAPGLPFRRSCA